MWIDPGFKSYKILLNKFENPSTHSSQDLMEILDTILQSKLKFSFILLMILVFYNIFLKVFYNFLKRKKNNLFPNKFYQRSLKVSFYFRPV